ncbi:hypothetical protein I4F81_001109 [Pyropia yezoensis]|uniref:Uncharacterized protein n=1 Tax=Pyropia yezoensis TaxID=2788 RepID=A0ACC3BLL7_PYRYE|nr:hypothetical protein I4F81_001109 [Neopyropia yezoensis]
MPLMGHLLWQLLIIMMMVWAGVRVVEPGSGQCRPRLELIDPTASWAQFVRTVYHAVADKTLRVFDSGVAAGHILEVYRPSVGGAHPSGKLVGIISLQGSTVSMLPWTLFGLRTLLVDSTYGFYSSMHTLLKFAGDRVTVVWLETFYADWGVVISHARSMFPKFFKRTSIKSLLCSRCPSAYVGDGYLVNEVMVNAAHKRTIGVRTAVLADLLETSLLS